MSEEEKDRIEEDNHAAIEEHNMDSQQDMPQEASEEQVTEKHDENDLSKLEATAHALEEEKQRYMRLQADFANYKKRTVGEKQQLSELIKAEILLSILPVVDNFERALQHPSEQIGEEVKSFIDGYDMIYKQLIGILEKAGVTKMQPVGQPFDPQYHQAVSRVAVAEKENDTIAEVLQEGYLLGDKTLRPAMVKVVYNG
ncbi:nucleotide exchange factor GrpE [uncultured Megasphaera sp.]|uniref:nucleotide exchange factor GrpE n=1 Tax=uncultured Megasphaera sp. TaxID=165188 RepID=UPI0025963C43|nr:nucleotide exchange factor GrpE [uncultured Megasphaera sp.]